MCIRDRNWEEGDATLCLPVGLGHWEDGRITLHGETFLTAAKAELRPDEDLVPVLKIAICLPEHSSMRRIKPVSYTHLDVYKRQPSGRTA